MNVLTAFLPHWVRFLGLGLGLYLLQEGLFPPAKPVVGPLAEGRVEVLKRRFVSGAGREPAADELARLVDEELDRDMLFQRAIALGLHLDDPMVRRRMLLNMQFLGIGDDKDALDPFAEAIEMRLHLGDEVVKKRLVWRMEELLLASNPPPPLTEEQLRAEFEQRREELRQPDRFTIDHVFFPEARAGEVAAAVARIEAERLRPREARRLGSRFRGGHRFRLASAAQLRGFLGPGFVAALEASVPQPGSWVGPLKSAQGYHHVWVDEVVPSQDATYGAARPSLRRSLAERARRESLQASLEVLRADFEVRR